MARDEAARWVRRSRRWPSRSPCWREKSVGGDRRRAPACRSRRQGGPVGPRGPRPGAGLDDSSGLRRVGARRRQVPAGSTAARRAASTTTLRAAPRCTPSPPQSARRSWSCSSAGATLTAATASSPTGGSYENLVWVSPSTLWARSRCASRGGVLPARAQRTLGFRRGPCRTGSTWRRHQIWIYDITHFLAEPAASPTPSWTWRNPRWRRHRSSPSRRPRRCGRQVVFTDAELDAEGLWPAVEARQAQRAAPRRRQRRGADPAGHVRQRPPDASS